MAAAVARATPRNATLPRVTVSIHRATLCLALACWCAPAHADLESDVDAVLMHYRVYVDAGYSHTSTRPANRIWRSKITNYRIDRVELNLAMARMWKTTTPESRWGWDLGVQAGADTELALPDPASGTKSVWKADVLRYIHAASVSYLIPVGSGLELTAGLIPGFPGYESFLQMENPNYTRGYITDYVPYFLLGARGDYSPTESLDLAFYLVTGWDYLLEYRNGPLVLAFAFDFGSEKSASDAGNPRKHWLATAFWARWEFNEHWWLGFRPELFDDPDGLLTGAEQRLRAIAVTLKYWFRPAEHHSFAVSLEYRYDRSTGPQGGFFSGSDNRLTPDQHIVLVALTWSFTGAFGQR